MIVSPLIPTADGYIDGRWCAADEGQTFPVINPATGDVLAQVARMGSGETRRAISAASRAMAHAPTIAQRREWLESIAAALIKKTPLTMIALFALLEREVQLPAGWANLVPGSAGAIADALLSHPDVAVISFTGSTEVGKELIVKSAAQVKRVALELGGNAPYIVFADADLDKAVDQLIVNKFRGSGQTCVCANRILVERRIAAEFSSRLASQVNALRLGNGMDDATDIGPLVDRAGYEKVRHHLTDALAKGAQLVAGAVPPPLDKEWGGFFQPTVISGLDRTMACWNEETFGPLVPIAEFDDEHDALTKANDTEYGLASYVFTQDAARAQRFVEALHFQHVAWNTGTGPTPEAPFGGMRQSGYGREGGIEGLFEFVDVKTSPAGI